MKIKRPGRVACHPVGQFALTSENIREFHVEATRTCRGCDAQVLLEVGDTIEEREEVTNNESGIVRRTYYTDCANCGGDIRIHEKEVSTGIVLRPQSLPEDLVLQEAA